VQPMAESFGWQGQARYGRQGGRRGGQAMRSWGISRPSRHLKRRLTTQTGEISPEGEIARPRVQAVVEPGKCAGVCVRGPKPANRAWWLNCASCRTGSIARPRVAARRVAGGDSGQDDPGTVRVLDPHLGRAPGLGRRFPDDHSLAAASPACSVRTSRTWIQIITGPREGCPRARRPHGTPAPGQKTISGSAGGLNSR
jgi:hypothetical protein